MAQERHGPAAKVLQADFTHRLVYFFTCFIFILKKDNNYLYTVSNYYHFITILPAILAQVQQHHFKLSGGVWEPPLTQKQIIDFLSRIIVSSDNLLQF